MFQSLWESGTALQSEAFERKTKIVGHEMTSDLARVNFSFGHAFFKQLKNLKSFQNLFFLMFYLGASSSLSESPRWLVETQMC